MKFLLIVVLLAFGWMLFRKLAAEQRPSEKTTVRPALRKPLTPAQRDLFARLQTALPSTMLMVQPALSQLIETHGDDAELMPDFAVCKRDASPIGIVILDAEPASQRIETLAAAAGLRVAHFRSTRLPNDQDIKDALGFL